MGLLSQLLGAISGNNNIKISEQLLFDKVIGFKSLVPGCGASLMLQNLAIAMSEKTKFNICVLDTNYLYPVQFPLLCTGEFKASEQDILTFSDDLSKIMKPTAYTNVYLAQLDNRNVLDMMSGKDSESCVTNLIAQLKSYFDIVLVDLSYELTNISQYSAIKCNKIILVADTSLKCLYNMKKALNTVVTLGVPLAKCNKVIINKYLEGISLGIENVLEDAGLEILTTVPLSYEIATLAASGKKIYGAISKNKDISSFNTSIEDIIDSLLEKTPLNSDYFDITKELTKLEEAHSISKVKEAVFVEDTSDSTEIIDSYEVELSDIDETDTDIVSDTEVVEISASESSTLNLEKVEGGR